MPQLELQHTVPAGQIALPHLISFGGRQSCLVQPLPGATHVPQLALQHSCPTGQILVPQTRSWSTMGGSGSTAEGLQACWVHIMSGLVHMLQDALQQTRPWAQTVFPQTCAVMGTQRAVPETTTHLVSLPQRTVAHLSTAGFRASTLIGLAKAPRASMPKSTRALGEKNGEVMMKELGVSGIWL